MTQRINKSTQVDGHKLDFICCDVCDTVQWVISVCFHFQVPCHSLCKPIHHQQDTGTDAAYRLFHRGKNSSLSIHPDYAFTMSTAIILRNINDVETPLIQSYMFCCHGNRKGGFYSCILNWLCLRLYYKIVNNVKAHYC